MNSKSIYIASQEPASGTVIVTMGIIERLKSRLGRVAYFCPVIQHDDDTDFIVQHFDLEIQREESFALYLQEAEHLISQNRFNEVLETIIDKVKNLERRYDFVVCQGLFKSSFSSSLDFDINLEIAKNLSAPFIRVVNGKDKSISELMHELTIGTDAIDTHQCIHAATFVNRIEASLLEQMQKELSPFCRDTPLYFLPEIQELDSPTVSEVSHQLGCLQILGNKDELKRVVRQSKIAAMTLVHFIDYLEDGDLIIVPGDRIDILLATITANYSSEFPMIAGILLTGGLVPTPKIMNLIKGITHAEFPILAMEGDTYSVALKVNHVPAKITLESDRKIALAMGLFSQHVNLSEIDDYLLVTPSTSITPTMFKYQLLEKARKVRKNIILPESEDERILRAVEILLRRDVVDITLLGNPKIVHDKAIALGIDISYATIIDPEQSPLLETFGQQFYEMRKHKGIELEYAKETMHNPLYFATMMVYNNYAHGMVCGAIHTTKETIRPALQIIKTRPGISIVSSVFFMCLESKVLVYGDCAVNQDPTAQELAQIAIASADTASMFGIEPKIAMLSYSTGESGDGDDVQKVRLATQLALEQRNDLLIEGPIQYDAAVDEKVAKIKLPESKVAGVANVFIFPDLNTGNNTYKAVQRSSNAIAIGPVLQGLKKPINDLSRGCLVEDIVNTVIITAIQAQGHS